MNITELEEVQKKANKIITISDTNAFPKRRGLSLPLRKMVIKVEHDQSYKIKHGINKTNKELCPVPPPSGKTKTEVIQ